MIADNLIKLRAPEPADVAAMYLWENERAQWPNGALRAPMSYQLLMNFVDNYEPDIFVAKQARFIIADKNSGEAIGCIDLTDFDAFNRRAEVGVVVSGSRRGQGIASAALALIIDYCRCELGMHQLYATVPVENAASRRLFEKCGFSVSGRLRSWIRHGSTFADAFLLQLLFPSN